MMHNKLRKVPTIFRVSCVILLPLLFSVPNAWPGQIQSGRGTKSQAVTLQRQGGGKAGLHQRSIGSRMPELTLYQTKLYPNIIFPEFSVPQNPNPPGAHVSSTGVDLHPYFTGAVYNRKTGKLRFSFAVANWGDSPCKQPFVYWVRPGLWTKQRIPEGDWASLEQKNRYVREFVAPGPPVKPVSLGPGGTINHTLTYDMGLPVVWKAGGVMVYVNSHFREGHSAQDQAPSYSGTYSNSAWLPIRPEGFNYKAVMLARKPDKPVQEKQGSILRIQLAGYRNMGANAFQLMQTTVRHAFYSRKLDPGRLLENPEAFDRFKIAIRSPFSDHRVYNNVDELRAMGAGKYLPSGKVFAYRNDVSAADWKKAKTVRVWIEKPQLERWIKYKHLSSIVYHK